MRLFEPLWKIINWHLSASQQRYRYCSEVAQRQIVARQNEVLTFSFWFWSFLAGFSIIQPGLFIFILVEEQLFLNLLFIFHVKSNFWDSFFSTDFFSTYVKTFYKNIFIEYVCKARKKKLMIFLSILRITKKINNKIFSK